MQKQHRLGQSRQFRYVYRRGAKAVNRDLTLLYVRSAQKRVGFSVSKKVGGAVTRNLIKRRLRECVRPWLPEMKNGLYVVVAHPCAAKLSYTQLRQSMNSLLRKLSLFLGESPPSS